ncbi:zinc finger protein 512B-like [Labeo rohita]|uniref:Zinc finger protein 512B-like n=1 Tax=Labeo rohita TaxID=84645 RepID=A0A498NGE1_LABRO|nr:zinc finger protein 512B-like [Labeo rohita]
MDTSSGARVVKPSSGLSKGRTAKQAHPAEMARMGSTENDNHGSSYNEKSEGKKKGRPRVEVQELRIIPATISEKLSHRCPYCEAVFATKVRLQKHKLWNHPERVTTETKPGVTLDTKSDPKSEPKQQKSPVKGNAKKRPMENSPPSPVFFKVKKTQEVSQPSQNGECAPQRPDRKQQQGTSVDAGGSESEGGSLPPPFPEEDPERMKHIPPAEAQWQNTISERGEVVCPTCSVVTRKTVHGLKKHMEICQKLRDALKCQQCQKQFRSKAGLNYHSMADHIKGCSAHFSSLMGYQYHQKRCGRELPDGQKPVFLCQQCVEKIEERKEEKTEAEELLDLERTPSGRVRRRSAQVAVFHLQEIAEDELAKDWGTKRRIKDDLVPDIKRLNYTRPGLPNFSPETVNGWKNEVKEKGFICCPNCNCEAIYSSVSGLKAHLASCNKGGGDVGKYTCLLCQKEFNSESGVKYHISKTHSQNWFRASTNEVINNKKKEPESNGLQKDMKDVVPGKRRGRKPKEHHLVSAPFPAETQSFSPAPAPLPPQSLVLRMFL